MRTLGLRQTLEACRAAGTPALVAYIVAGDPSLEATECYAAALSHGGVDIIELGVPFSDPLADGPVNQRASERALAAGTTLRGVLDCAARIRSASSTPLVLFTYLNPLLQMGLVRFAEQARAAGVSGVLAVDLPPEEAGDYQAALAAQGLETVFLAAPTTPGPRLRTIAAASTGFVYYVSRTGVTGARAALSSSLAEELANVRAQVDKPFVVGFGISGPEHARELASRADGVVIGSALVERLAAGGSVAERAAELQAFVRSIKAALVAGRGPADIQTQTQTQGGQPC